MTFRRFVPALLIAAAPLSAQTVFNGFTQNPTCAVGGTNTCATAFAPTGAALTARNSFFSNLSSSVATQNFESIAPGTSAPLTLNFGFAGNATLTGAGSVEQQSASVTPFGRFATSGSRYFTASAAGAANFSITFSQAVAGFGLYGMDWGDVGGSVQLRLLNGNTLLNTLTIQPSLGEGFFPQLNGGMRFWGVLFNQNTFNKVEFLLTGDPENQDVFGFDDLTVADASEVKPPDPNVVPEPSTYALMATGLVGLAVAARRRRRNM